MKSVLSNASRSRLPKSGTPNRPMPIPMMRVACTKARFNALSPDNPDQQQAQRNLTQVCGERASGIASLPFERIERAVQPDGAQRSALKELQDATSQAANLLSVECPTYRALTPVGRLQAMEQRLDAMLRAVQTVQPALEKFYGSLGDEQKERFNRLSPAQG